MPIDGRKNHSNITKELITKYKETGKIGNIEPKSMKHALNIANAIAYSVKENNKVKCTSLDDLFKKYENILKVSE